MKSIEFRAKKISDGEWVYGYYFKTPLTDESTDSDPKDGWYFLSGRERYCIANKNGCVYEVDPETVCQYTGLKDKHGIKVYDGDVLIKDGHWDMYVDFIKGLFYLVSCDVVQRINWMPSPISLVEDREVFSNIYENPELLIV